MAQDRFIPITYNILPEQFVCALQCFDFASKTRELGRNEYQKSDPFNIGEAYFKQKSDLFEVGEPNFKQKSVKFGVGEAYFKQKSDLFGVGEAYFKQKSVEFEVGEAYFKQIHYRFCMAGFGLLRKSRRLASRSTQYSILAGNSGTTTRFLGMM